MNVKNCAECPFSRHLDGNRYVCTIATTANDVVMGHWEPASQCVNPIENYNDSLSSSNNSVSAHFNGSSETARKGPYKPIVKILPDDSFVVDGYRVFMTERRCSCIKHIGCEHIKHLESFFQVEGCDLKFKPISYSEKIFKVYDSEYMKLGTITRDLYGNVMMLNNRGSVLGTDTSLYNIIGRLTARYPVTTK